jgi:hypothetical protein
MTALVVTIVLQIVLIVLVLDLKKKKKSETILESPASPDQRDFRKQKESDNRFARKPPHEHKIKPVPMQGQNIDQVERSLRDINLRLKNAEKDQEKERRRIKDTISPSSSSPSSSRRFDNHKPRERDDRFRRNDRPRHDFQQNRPENRQADSSQGFREEKVTSKNNVDTQEKRPPQFQGPAAIAPIAPIAPPIAPIAFPPEVSATVEAKASEPVFETSTTLLETRENLQHGRKMAVKRRILNLEESQSAEPGDGALKDGVVTLPSPQQAAEPKAQADTNKAAEPSLAENESFASGPISFGR